MGTHQLAQLNVDRRRAPLDSAQLADFVHALDPVNALADASPGSVWLLQRDGGNAAGMRALGDDMLIVNLGVWESPAAFTFASLSPAPDTVG